MSQPTPYTRQFSFTDFSVTSPSLPPPGVQIDAELNAIKATLSAVLANLALIQRDDTKLANGSVTQASIDASVVFTGLTPTLTTGVIGTLAAGASATGAVRLVSGSLYAIDLGIPQGPSGIGGVGSGTVSNVTGFANQGVTISIATPTSVPAITIGLGNITPTGVASTGTVTGTNLSGTNTGDQTITLTGAITGSGVGSFATTLAAGAVTLAKLANLGAMSLIGNITGGSAVPTAITIGAATGNILDKASGDSLYAAKTLPAVAKTAVYTLLLTDANGAVTTTAGGVVIPANATVAFPVWTTILIYNDSASSQAVSITSDTLRLAGSASTGTRTIPQRSWLMALKVNTTEWVASGPGVT